jgi:hypothetical protein
MPASPIPFPPGRWAASKESNSDRPGVGSGGSDCSGRPGPLVGNGAAENCPWTGGGGVAAFACGTAKAALHCGHLTWLPGTIVSGTRSCIEHCGQDMTLGMKTLAGCQTERSSLLVYQPAAALARAGARPGVGSGGSDCSGRPGPLVGNGAAENCPWIGCVLWGATQSIRTCSSARSGPGTAPAGDWWSRPEMARR